MACIGCGAVGYEHYASVATYCKPCWRKHVKDHRAANIDRVRAYDKLRAVLPKRVEARKAYAKTPSGKRAHAAAQKTYRARNRTDINEKVRAYRAANPELTERWWRAPGSVASRAAYRAAHPERYKARTAVSNAVRDGKLFKESCEVCGNWKTHGHHDDYAKPLSVRWLCPEHHKLWHDTEAK